MTVTEVDRLQQVETHEPGSHGWNRQRSTSLGGSEVAAVLGLSPWESAYSLWHRKTNPDYADQSDNDSQEWGRRLESVILAKWADTHPDHLVLDGRTWLRDGWMLANPDAIAEDRDGRQSVVEIKTARDGTGWGKTGTSDIPVYYRTQVGWYMAVLDVDTAHVAVLIAGSDYREYTIERDPADEAFVVERCREFMGSLRMGIRPDIDGHSATLDVVRAAHPDIDPTDVEIGADLAGAWMDALAAEKAAKAARSKASALLLDAMGTARNACVAGSRIAYRTARTQKDGTPGTPFLAVDKTAETPTQ